MTIAVLFLLLSISFVILQVSAWFILFHLSYYNVSYRINILTSFIQTVQDPLVNPSLRIKRLRTCGYLFDQICLVSENLNSTFSLTVLVSLIILMVLCTTSLFFFIFAISAAVVPNFILLAKFAFLFMFIGSVAMIIIILTSAELPIKEVRLILNFS